MRYAARDGQAVIATWAGASPAVLPGYPVRMLDGNPWAATAPRLKALRGYTGGALPGQARVGYDPAQELAREGVPGENGHPQERALLAAVEAPLAAGQVWVMDRNCWGLHW